MSCNRIAYASLLIFFCFAPFGVSGQSQKVADSLAEIYKKGELRDTARLELLRSLAFNELDDLRLALHYAEELIEQATLAGNDLYLYRGYVQKGNQQKALGDLDKAMDAFIKSIEVARKIHYFQGEASVYGAIAGIYSSANNHRTAMVYYNKAISTLRQSGDSLSLAAAILNAGDEFLTSQIYDSALLYLREARIISEKIDYVTGKAYTLGNIGMVYANIGENSLAEEHITEATRILEELGDYYPVCVYLISMSDIYHKRGNPSAALSYAARSLQLAHHYSLKEQISESSLKLSELHMYAGNTMESFNHYKNHIVYRDSVNNLETVQKMADLRTELELLEKEELLVREKWIRNMFIAAFGAMIFLAAMMYWNFRAQRLKNRKITEQKEEIERKNEDLILLNEEKSNLIGIVAHDLKSPINQIKGLISLARLTSTDNGESAAYLDMVEQSSIRLGDMINKILNVEAIEATPLSVTLESVNFSDVVRANVSRCIAEVTQKQLRIQTSLPDAVMVNADLRYTDQVIDNLLSNAIKFSPPGKNIFITITRVEAMALCEIRDEGPGLSESDKKKLFKKYQKLSATPTNNESSTGLGLSIVKKFVDAMGGEIWCESELGQGASFFVRLKTTP
jgi:signal transduction histidine kinase/Tfp pilus assembly protein PilF